MWVEERNGKFRFCERYDNPITGTSKRVSCTLDRDTASSRKKAAAILQRKISEALQATASPEMTTLQELVDRYAAHQAVTVKHSTAARNAYEATAVIRILGGDTLVDRMTAAYVKERLMNAGETATCTNGRIKYLKALIRWGYKMDLISSPAIADKVDYLPDPRKKEKLLTKYMETDELKAVLDAMTVTRWKLLTEFLCLSGLRIGELIALTDKDVSERYIHIDKTYDLRTDTTSDTPKTDTSNRDVYIQPELARCISKMRKERKVMLLAAGVVSPLFYPDMDGGYLHYHSYNKYLKETTESVIGRRLTAHACRHTMTSIFAGNGASLDTISRRLGHASSDITRQIYLHQTAEQRRNDEAEIDRVSINVGG